ncbi:uncharacterized protein [Coffea arabica]|uniref:Uncharacterized protein n=1 Tax=Coffea arabica TaxID=13443 RepID=A0A6P6SHH2_COFAR
MSERSRTRSRMFDDQMAVVLGKLGDDDPCDQEEEEEGQSTLLDRYERLSFEVHLKQAMLGRSLSEPSSSAVARTRAAGSGAAQKGKQGGAAAGHRKSAIHRVVRMLIKPLVVGTSRVFARKDGVRSSSTPVVQGKDHRRYLWKAAFSRSMRGV